MNILGNMLIGQADCQGKEGELFAIDPATDMKLAPSFGAGSTRDVDRACQLALEAFDTYRETSPSARAAFLEAIADGIVALGGKLLDRAHQESGLPLARLEGERARTVGQLRLFAKVVRDGHWHGAVIDTALPDRQPQPRPDLRMRKLPLGPVAVFAASNFPLAFSIAGGDTASALAAGCPVVAKAHSAHLGTSELVGRVIQKAVRDCGLPEGVFSLLIGSGEVVGQHLVAHPAIKAVGFTGSRAGGLALVDTARNRPEPIPVFAEMSSINPVFLLPGALATRGRLIGTEFVDSLTLGAGQFCTNPGLIIVLEGEALSAFVDSAATALVARGSQTMLTPGIHRAYERAAAHLAESGAACVARGRLSATPHNQAQAALFQTTAERFVQTPAMRDEVFGPASLVVVCRDVVDMLRVAESLEGQLTATVHAEDNDHDLACALLPVLERKAGRILFGGFPTGVELGYAMVHGGPFPATSNSAVTSVGASAIERFLRPVCYQNMPDALRHPSLKDGNPLSLWRLVDAEFARQ